MQLTASFHSSPSSFPSNFSNPSPSVTEFPLRRGRDRPVGRMITKLIFFAEDWGFMGTDLERNPCGSYSENPRGAGCGTGSENENLISQIGCSRRNSRHCIPAVTVSSSRIVTGNGRRYDDQSFSCHRRISYWHHAARGAEAPRTAGLGGATHMRPCDPLHSGHLLAVKVIWYLVRKKQKS
jgi:hypothetical protein